MTALTKTLYDLNEMSVEQEIRHHPAWFGRKCSPS